MRRLAIAWLAGGLAGCMPGPRTPAAATLYVAGAPGLRRLDALDLSAARNVPVAGTVTAVLSNPRRREVEIAAAGPNRLYRFDALSGAALGQVALPAAPAALVLSRDGERAVVAAGGELVRVALAAGKLEDRVGVGNRIVGLAFAPDDSHLVAIDAGANAVLWLNPDTLRRESATALAAEPAQLILMPFGHKAFVLLPDRNQVAVLDTVDGNLLAYLPVGPQPAAMLLKPDGGELYVANRGGGTVSIVNTHSNEVAGTMLAGRGPSALAVNGDGSLLYVANREAGTVSGIQIEDRKMIATVNVGQQPVALALGPLQQYLFVADSGSNDLAVLHADFDNADHRNVVTMLPAPIHAGLLAVTTVEKR